MIEITVCYNVTTSKLAALSSSSSSHNTLIWQFLLCVKLMAEIFSRVCPLSHERRRLYVVITLHRTQSVDAQCKILLILISISIVGAAVCCSECCSPACPGWYSHIFLNDAAISQTNRPPDALQRLETALGWSSGWSTRALQTPPEWPGEMDFILQIPL